MDLGGDRTPTLVGGPRVGDNGDERGRVRDEKSELPVFEGVPLREGVAPVVH